MNLLHKREAERLLEDERGRLDDVDRDILRSLEQGVLAVRNPESLADERMSFGDRMADRVATFGGSWTFIGSFCAVLLAWMALNASAWVFRPFDPYPFILLNLVLSCVAALQAPVIMMSQRRTEAKDRVRAENDYRVNLKAELEIRLLHERIDHEMTWQRECLEELRRGQARLLDRCQN